MKYNIDNDRIYLSIDKDKKINDSILNICNELDISFAWINGLGAICNPEVGYFDTEKKDYVKKTFNGEFELISLVGNLTFNENNRFIHTHITFSDTNFRAYGGHLFDCRIAAAGEFILFTGKKPIHRSYNKDIGLSLWNCKI